MTDKELLELAAKAAGIKGRSDSFGFVTMEAGYDADPLYWRPLTDDGDALRLAVKLVLHVDVNEFGTLVFAHESLSGCNFGLDAFGEEQPCMSFREEYGACPYAATRRAIVRAAAEIGRAK